MTLKIKPFGRLGNIIGQIIKCITENNHKYKHRYIDLKIIKNKELSILKNFPDVLEFPEFQDKDEMIEDNFWTIETKVKAEKLIETIDKYIKPYIDYELIDNKGINFVHDLIIHVRSGDIFSINFPLNNYTQPPYSFYKKIIEENNFKNIYILSENYNLNPVIPKLLENYNNIKFLSNDLETDFKIMLNSQNFVNSNSTLSLIVNSISKIEKKNFSSSLWNKGYSINDYHYYNYEDYYKYEIKTYEEKIDRLLNL